MELEQAPWARYVISSDLLLIKAKGSIGRSLSDKLQKGYVQRESMVDHFIGLSIVRGKENVMKWENESTEAWFSKGEWHSVYRLEQSKRPYNFLSDFDLILISSV